MSYANLHLYGASLPSYHSRKPKDKGEEECIDAGDPRNRERILAMADQFK